MLKKHKLILSLFALLILLSACGNKYEGDFSYEVQDFTFTNQDGDEFGKKDLDGKFWVADFVYTTCTTVCPPMTANMVKLQQLLKEEGMDDVQLVSFTVDPEVDTPEVLKNYGEVRGATFDNWNFLSGYTFKDIKELSVKSFKSLLEEYEDSDDILHVTSFFLVSPDGFAIKRYTGTSLDQVKDIVKDIKKMQ